MVIEGLVFLFGRGRVVVFVLVRGILYGIVEDVLKVLGNIFECCFVCVF